MILDSVNSPQDLKRLNLKELNILADEIREFLIEVISETGGHLSSNLGVVELTIALHYVFNSPVDKLVFDVGHQSYIHKILTGRKDRLKTIRSKGGLSGFNKRCESVHDCFGAGHSSTSISAALGFLYSKQIKQEAGSIVALIGDGAMTAGMAFEGLNNAAVLEKNFIVVLNDNQMSISQNVGGMSLYLDKIRTDRSYQEVKGDISHLLDKIPIVGSPIKKVAKEARDAFKQVVIPGMFFEEMGYTYLGPIDGHNIKHVITVLRQAKKINGPVLVHLKTVKGKGHIEAENNPQKYHGIKPVPKAKKDIPTYSSLLGDKLIDYKKQGDNIVAITAAMPSGTGLQKFSELYEDSFFDVGIAEQHAVTFAAALALSGVKPFVAIYSTFLQRAYDQVLHDVCIQKAPVVFLLDRAGIVGEDGATHNGVFDLSYLSHIPNIKILAPRDAKMFEAMLDYAKNFKRGPVAIRYPKGEAKDLGYQVKNSFCGCGQFLKKGENIAILAVGSMVEVALKVSESLEEIGVTVADAVFVKPLDYCLINELASLHKHLIILEENAVIGGYGTAVLSYLNDTDYDVKVHIFGIPDKFLEHGKKSEILDDIGLNVQSTCDYIRGLS